MEARGSLLLGNEWEMDFIGDCQRAKSLVRDVFLFLGAMFWGGQRAARTYGITNVVTDNCKSSCLVAH